MYNTYYKCCIYLPLIVNLEMLLKRKRLVRMLRLMKIVMASFRLISINEEELNECI